MLAGGHCIPTCYALWMIMGQALERKYQATGDKRYYADPAGRDPADRRARVPPRRRRDGDAAAGSRASPTIRSSRRRRRAASSALAGHAESIDVTNDVNGGPSGIGVATAAGKAAFWDVAGAGIDAPKIIAFEGEFAMTEGHAQELKTQALALKVGKRLRVMISDNNAGIDDSLIGGVIDQQVRRLRPRRAVDVVRLERLRGRRRQRLRPGGRRAEDDGGLGSGGSPADGADRQDDEGLLARGRRAARFPSIGDQVVGYPEPSLRDEDELGVLRRAGRRPSRSATASQFQGIRDGAGEGHARAADPVQDQHRRRHVGARRNGLGDWLADRLVEIGDTLRDDLPLRIAVDQRSVPRRAAARGEPAGRAAEGHGHQRGVRGDEGRRRSRCSARPARWPARGAAISEIVKWLNYVTGNRMLTIAADLSESINLEHGSIWGHYDPETNPLGTRLKAAIQEAGNVVDRHRPGQPERVARSRRSSRACGRSAAPTARSRR